MRRIRADGEHELVIKRSRFRCVLARVETEQQAKDFVAEQRKLHHEARHHCSAQVLDHGRTQRSNDDGEPAGTAGAPMLEVLRRNEITGVIAVVSRYFGGVLLGAGGLVRAYGSAVSAALEQVGLVELRPVRVVFTTVDHAAAGRLDNDLRAAGFTVSDVDYAARVRFELHEPVDEVEAFEVWLAQATNGSAQAELGAVRYAEVPI